MHELIDIPTILLLVPLAFYVIVRKLRRDRDRLQRIRLQRTLYECGKRIDLPGIKKRLQSVRSNYVSALPAPHSDSRQKKTLLACFRKVVANKAWFQRELPQAEGDTAS